MSCSHCPIGGVNCRGDEVARLCQLVDPTHPDYRPDYIRVLPIDPERWNPPQYPAIAEQVGSALSAVGRAIGAAVQGVQVMRSGDEIARCLAICAACEYFVAAEERCSVCGCYAALKARLATEHCPLSEPKW